MRINENQKKAIIEAVKNIDNEARIWLFGSRADDSKKGGDIDIAVFSDIINKNSMLVIKVRRFICDKIGEQKIDIITTSNGTEAIFRLAMAEGIELI